MSAEYWVWLQQVLGFSNCAVSRVIAEYKTAKAFHDADIAEKVKRCRLTKSQADRLGKIPRKIIYDIVNECKNNNISIITPESEHYPERLLNIPDPPAALYVKGNWFSVNNTPIISIVGPRKVSTYGEKCSYVIANTLASCGFVIVSGGALGGDSAAHLGAIDEGKPTVCVLGSGINNDYLKENEDLRNRIVSNGCVISEYPPSYPASKITFPQRNRIVAGLSDGVVVVEGGYKSGTLITARLASEQGKDVFVIPGSPSEACYEGSNALIFDGAKPLLNINDIIKEYYPLYKDKIGVPDVNLKLPDNTFGSIVKEKIKKLKKENRKDRELQDIKNQENLEIDTSVLSPIGKSVYNVVLTLGDSFTADDITDKSGIDIGEVLSSLIELEIFGIIVATHGGRYHINR